MECTFHMKDLFPAFREAERRVKISFLHWPFLRNFNSKQNAIEACFGMVYLGLQQHPDLDFYIALSNNASGFLKKWHGQRKYLMNLESGNSRKQKSAQKTKVLAKGKYLIVLNSQSETKQTLKNKAKQTKQKTQPNKKNSQWSKLKQFEQQNR